MLLPKIQGPKGDGRSVVGTFRAEQTSRSSFQLVSVAPSSLSRQPKEESPQKNRSERRRKLLSSARNTGNGCTVLPALSTIDPLLIATQEAFFQPGTIRKASAPDDPEQKSRGCATSRQSNIDRVVQRLHPDAKSQMEDVEVLGWLTRPKTGQRASPLDELKPTSRTSKGLSIEILDDNSRPCSNLQSDRKHKFDTHYDLFESCLTPSSRSGLRSKLPTLQPFKESKDAPLQFIHIDVLPEDAASAFFKAEEEAAQHAKETATKKRNSFQGRVQNLVIIPSRRASKESMEADPANPKRSPISVSKDWAAVLNEMAPVPGGPGAKLLKSQCVASENLRILCFGVVGNEHETRHSEREKVFYETSGTGEQLCKVFEFWNTLDTDGSNRVDISEWISFAEKCEFKKACEKVSAALLGKRSSFTFEDMLRCLWPCAQASDIDKMKKIIKEQQRAAKRVKTPPLLDPSEFEGLVQTFRHFDSDRSGTVSLQELVNCGLLDSDQAAQYMKDWDEDGSGELDELEFSRMLCPVGFRAYPEARIATDDEGNQVINEPKFGWRLRQKHDRRVTEGGPNSHGRLTRSSMSVRADLLS